MLVSDLEWFGYLKFVLKHDNERALTALARQVVKILKERNPNIESVLKENSAPYDSQSNGGTEVGGAFGTGHV